MKPMTYRITLFAVALVLTVFAAACGGGGGDDGAGKGSRVTDPGKVPTAVPLQNATLYHIQGDLVTTSGSSSNITPVSGLTPVGAAKNHTVVSGDTCSTIASKYGIGIDDLRKVNRIINDACSNLVIGDILRLPAAPTPFPGSTASRTPQAGSGKEYTVKSGDTCGVIAASYGVTVANIIATNGLDQNCTLKVGQVVRIP